MTAHAPVETRPAQRTSFARQRFDVDLEFSAEPSALLRELRALVAGAQKTPLFEAVKDKYAQLARKVVITNSRLPQGRLARAGEKSYGTDPVRYPHETFEKPCYVGIGEPKVAMPTLSFHGEQLRIEHLREMGADSLLCNACHSRKFCRGQRLARHEGGKNLGPGVVSD
jgi:hypothetical protein